MKYCSEVWLALHQVLFIADQYTFIRPINKNVPTGNFIVMFHYLANTWE